MLESIIYYVFVKTGRMWKVGGKLIRPSEEDIMVLLDEAAVRLAQEPVGTRLDKGGLIVEKKHRGHDVYVMVGSYD